MYIHTYTYKGAAQRRRVRGAGPGRGPGVAPGAEILLLVYYII